MLCVVITISMCCILCVVIPIYFMYHILNFYVIWFLKFIAYTMNSKMIESGMMMLTERKKADVTDVDVDVS
jgi:hypothetical protein